MPSQSEILQSDSQAEGPRLIYDLITKRTFISAATKDQPKDYFFISVLSPIRTHPLVKLSSDNSLCVVSQNLQLSAFNCILSSCICPVLAVKDLKLYPTTKGRYTNSEIQEPGKYCPCRTSSFSGNKEQRHSCQQLKISWCCRQTHKYQFAQSPEQRKGQVTHGKGLIVHEYLQNILKPELLFKSPTV